jgi:hypothetical protein
MFIKIVPLCGYFLKINNENPRQVLFLFYSDLIVQVTRLNIFLILDDESQILHNISPVISNNLVLQPYQTWDCRG